MNDFLRAHLTITDVLKSEVEHAEDELQRVRDLADSLAIEKERAERTVRVLVGELLMTDDRLPEGILKLIGYDKVPDGLSVTEISRDVIARHGRDRG